MVDADPDSTQRLKSFRDKVSKRRLVRFWRDREQLKSDIIISLLKRWETRQGLGGFVEISPLQRPFSLS